VVGRVRWRFRPSRSVIESDRLRLALAYAQGIRNRIEYYYYYYYLRRLYCCRSWYKLYFVDASLSMSLSLSPTHSLYVSHSLCLSRSLTLYLFLSHSPSVAVSIHRDRPSRTSRTFSSHRRIGLANTLLRLWRRWNVCRYAEQRHTYEMCAVNVLR